MKTEQMFTISKSSFIRGVKCKKSLWLHFNEPDQRDELSDAQQQIFDTGHSVGALAQQLFPGGVDASRGEPGKIAEAVAYTRELIESGQRVIYEAAFVAPLSTPKSPKGDLLHDNGNFTSETTSLRSQGDLLCYIDILVNDVDGWAAYEVKASTSVKDYHILDVAFQYHVITGSGLPLKEISLVHLNNQYIRRGELDLKQLFTIEPMLDQITPMLGDLPETIFQLDSMLEAGMEPVVEMGRQCSNPYPCDFIGYCTSLLGTVEEEPVGEANRDQEALARFLDELEYPLYFMDFETIQFAVPMYNESRPYQKVPFQWSVHKRTSGRADKRTEGTGSGLLRFARNDGGEHGIEHFEFLGTPPGDPRREFVEALLDCLGDQGSIVVWNKTFEMTILRELARDFTEYAEKISRVLERVVDLMVPFRKRHLYLPEMKGSYSLKAVLPTLIQDLSYEELAIQEGGAASMAYEQLYTEEDPEVIRTIRNDLLEYCKLDTLAMVRILEELAHNSYE